MQLSMLVYSMRLRLAISHLSFKVCPCHALACEFSRGHWHLLCRYLVHMSSQLAMGGRTDHRLVNQLQALVVDYEKLKKRTLRLMAANPLEAETHVLAPKVTLPLPSELG
jgi:hypothetical protein